MAGVMSFSVYGLAEMVKWIIELHGMLIRV